MAAAHRDATLDGTGRARRPRALLGALVTALAMALPQVAMAGIWTPIPSGTTETINAVDHHADDRFWYATTNPPAGSPAGWCARTAAFASWSATATGPASAGAPP